MFKRLHVSEYCSFIEFPMNRYGIEKVSQNAKYFCLQIK